ncbi:MAG: preprotein translocase subunit SecG [Lachnospiraceae bacterium]|nr:preprotein translocase subunit SecG [Lachnospiraceae bacterium]
MRIALEVLILFVSVALIVIVLSQEGKETGLGSLSGTTDTYWSRNKGRSKEGMLVKWTTLLTVLLLVLSLLLSSKFMA